MTLKQILAYAKSLLPSERAKAAAAEADRLSARLEASLQVLHDLKEAARLAHERPAKRKYQRKIKPSSPLNVEQLRKVRGLFNSEFATREANRFNQRAWVKAMRFHATQTY